MPLGESWSGVCRAERGGEWRPDAGTLQTLCNFGYARPHCVRVPADGPDAVRFSISHDREDIVRIYWVMEKNHLPCGHGPLDYSRAEAGFLAAHPDASVARQAQVYVDSYLRRKAGRSRA